LHIEQSLVALNQRRFKLLEQLSFESLIFTNPYLFEVQKFTRAQKLVKDLMDALLSSSEEKLFGDFLEDLAVFVAQMTCGGHKSSAPGVDLEFIHEDMHYVVSIKSGPSWGNSSQQAKLEQDLKNAVARIKQSRRGLNVQPVLGICYGKTKSSYLRGYRKVVGQNFWYLISGNADLYTDIIEPVGYHAKEHNEQYELEKSNVINRFTGQFIDQFCDASGAIDWVKLVEFNSHNLEVER
jgi:hypothetical protein